MKSSKKIMLAAAVLLLAAALFAGAGAAEENALPTLKVGSTTYTDLNAFAAAMGGTYSSNTITFPADVPNGKGIFIGSDGDPLTLTFNFGGYTYTVASEPVGSPGTESQGFHLEDGNNITLKNGTLTSKSGSGVKILAQTYCDITLDNVTLDGSNMEDYFPNGDYVLNHNCGSATIKNGSNIYAKTGDFAFDICKKGTYAEPSVTVESSAGKIVGNIEYTISGTGDGVLDIKGGYIIGDIKIGASSAPTTEKLKIDGGSFTVSSPAAKALIDAYKTAGSAATTTVGQQTVLTLDISESYTIYIPAAFNFTKDSGNTYSSSASNVGVTDINVAAGKKVAITLTATVNDFKLKSGTKEITYKGEFGAAQIQKDIAFCTTTDNVTPNTDTLKFTTTNTAAITGTGSFTDTLTFSAAIVSSA